MGWKQEVHEPGFKIEVVETKKALGLSLRETAKRFEVRSTGSVFKWERIYDEQGPEGLMVENRGRPPNASKLPTTEEETLEQEVMRLRMENDYLKKLNALVREKEKQARKKKWQ